jgi:hypothetical protein
MVTNSITIKQIAKSNIKDKRNMALIPSFAV